MYRYNPNRHSVQVTVTDKGQYEIALYSALSGRKLKIYGVWPTREIAQARAEAICNWQPGKGRRVKK